MTKYTAQFAEHTTTRNSDRKYTHAWIVTREGHIVAKGFSGSEELAKKSASAEISRTYGPTPQRHRKSNRLFYTKLASSQGFKTLEDFWAQRDKEAADRLRNTKAEIAAVTPA